MSFRHVTKYSYGNTVWHRVTGTRGMIFGIQLRENSMAQYIVVFEDNRNEVCCYESELMDQPATANIPPT